MIALRESRDENISPVPVGREETTSREERRCGRTWLLVPLFGMVRVRESTRLKEMRRPRAKWLWRRGDQLRKFTAELAMDTRSARSARSGFLGRTEDTSE